MPVGLFARLSTAKATRDLTELSFDRQHERSAAFCEAKGWQVVKLYQDLGPAYRKPGMATAPRRNDFERSLRDIESGAIRGLVFFKLDRFVRDHGDFEGALAVAEKHRAVLASVTEPLDTSTPMGEAVARLLVTFARMESQTIALRVAAQAEQRARLGKPWTGGRHRPYGYRASNGGLEIVEEEAEVIREIVKRLLAGRSIGQVVNWLRDEGIPAPRGGELAGPALANLDRKLASAKYREIAEQRRRDEDALVEAARQRFVLQDANADPQLKPRAYAEVKAELDRRIAEATRLLSEDEAVGVLMDLPRLEAELREYWDTKADIERRRAITRAILDRVVISPATRRGPGIDPDRVDPKWKL